MVAVTADGAGRGPFDFSLANDVVRLTDVDRTHGSASVVCLATGAGSIGIAATGVRTTVPVIVQPVASATVRVTMSPTALALVNGTTNWVAASVSSPLAEASREARYSSSDTTVAVVDSVSGQVRATGPGTAAIVASSRAAPSARGMTSVTVTPGSALIGGLALFSGPMLLVVGDSDRVRASVSAARNAPPNTSLAATYASTDSQIARVSATGVVRALRTGSATILVGAAAAPLVRAAVFVYVLEPAP
jgi:hypothetical protein